MGENRCVGEFLNRYEGGGVSYGDKAVGLALAWDIVDGALETRKT